MTNPQDNLGTSPPVSPSNSSSSTSPSVSPKPRFRRQKMLARKTVASRSLRKALNEKLRASQRKESPAKESDSSSESEAFISASKGEEHGSSDTNKNQETPGEGVESSRRGCKKKEKVLVICGGVKESGNKSGGSSFGEAAEADILKKVGASYDPKKCKASLQKAPTASKPIKKSKMSSPKPIVPSVPKGRATRSRVKQSEAELLKALEESRKKKKEKGKAKVVESSKAAEEEEEETELTSSKKSSSEPVSAEPSLVKRNRSAVKGKQVKITKEEEKEEWSGEEEEEESEKEQDRFVIFGRRKILKGRLLKDLDEPGIRRLVDALSAQG
ncbi:uncharacterized protein [Nicotiana sylvestris]|uniref:uncharacterized protein n=1 Tax=Nicotiana sylvestris TaxID=4096 RepID=UPI00388CDC9A